MITCVRITIVHSMNTTYRYNCIIMMYNFLNHVLVVPYYLSQMMLLHISFMLKSEMPNEHGRVILINIDCILNKSCQLRVFLQLLQKSENCVTINLFLVLRHGTT